MYAHRGCSDLLDIPGEGVKVKTTQQCYQIVAMAEKCARNLKKCHRIVVSWQVGYGGTMAAAIAMAAMVAMVE